MMLKNYKTVKEIEKLRKLHGQSKVDPNYQYRGIEIGYLHNPGVIYHTAMGPAIMPNLSHNFIYRGQNREYLYFQPSIYRKPIIEDGFSNELRIFYRELQLREFELLINKFPRVKIWMQKGFYVWVEAIAQHYGLYTTLLDVTNNFDVSLFFACCKYDRHSYSYRPLVKEDFIDEQDEYGVIYGKGQMIGDLFINDSRFKPIGYQPFMRPNDQCGFVYCLSENEKDIGFDWKVKFKHDLGYSQKIFEEFEGGNKIFSKKDVESIEIEFQKVIDANSYSINAFKKTTNELGIDENTTKKYLSQLNNNNIKIDQKPYEITRQQIRKIDQKWTFEGFLKEECGIQNLHTLPIVRQPL